MLSFFSEVGKTQRLGGLILALFAERDDDQNDQCDHVRKHLIELLDGKVRAGGDEDVENVAAAKEDGSEHAYIRAPDREDDEAIASQPRSPNALFDHTPQA